MKLPVDIDRITTLEEAKNAIEILLKAYLDLKRENDLLRLEIARLKGQPKKPQFKSPSQNQSSVTKFLKEKQSWHKSSKGKIPIDNIENLPEVEKCECGGDKFKSLRTYTKTTQGMIIKRNNVLYKGRVKQCIRCGKKYTGICPSDLKGLSFDSTTQSLASHLKFDNRFTHPLIHRFFKGFGMQISYGEITEILKRNSRKLSPVFNHLKTVGVKKSTYTQSDATGSKRRYKNGEIINQYINILGNKFLSIFKITPRYNALGMNKLLGRNGQKKPLISDDGSPNNACRCNGHQLCWIHEIRLYKKLFPFFTSHQKLREQILSEWRGFYCLAKQYGADPPDTATLQTKKEIEILFDKITGQITEYADLNKQLMLTRKKKEKLLFFLDHPYLPIQNNQCEQDLREYVIIRKISGMTNSITGDRSIERHLSVIQTIKKQGLPVFQTLHGLLTGELSPAILTAKSI